MAAAKKKSDESIKMTPAQLRKENEKLKEEIEKLKNSSRCIVCDTLKRKDDFYVSTDPKNKTGHTPICKLCTKKIVFEHNVLWSYVFICIDFVFFAFQKEKCRFFSNDKSYSI